MIEESRHGGLEPTGKPRPPEGPNLKSQKAPNPKVHNLTRFHQGIGFRTCPSFPIIRVHWLPAVSLSNGSFAVKASLAAVGGSWREPSSELTRHGDHEPFYGTRLSRVAARQPLPTLWDSPAAVDPSDALRVGDPRSDRAVHGETTRQN